MPYFDMYKKELYMLTNHHRGYNPVIPPAIVSMDRRVWTVELGCFNQQLLGVPSIT